jgi:Threonine synthase
MENYLLDPHGACGYQALSDLLEPGEKGIFLETAHPAKFKDTVEPIIGEGIVIPQTLRNFMSGVKKYRCDGLRI